MERAFYREAAFNQQANQIESALTHLALPARVAGGVIREDRVRYHLTPAVGAQPLRVHPARGRCRQCDRGGGAADRA